MNKAGKIATIVSLLLLAAVLAIYVSAGPKQCNDGVDNDNDGLTDYPNDPGCSGMSDNDEHGASLVCDNGADASNDRDTLADFQLSGGDPGCTSATDSSEIDGECDDSTDSSDRDALADGSDPGCSSTSDATETDGECDDSADSANDADALADGSDPGCVSTSDSSEVDAECDDLADNDGDTFTDYPADSGCTSYSDNTELIPQCEDGTDNDGDGKTDFGASESNDSKCSSSSDNDESPRDFCNDTDGINYFTVGNTTGEDNSNAFNLKDSCMSSTIVLEWYCGTKSADFDPINQTQDCTALNATGCIFGRCFI